MNPQLATICDELGVQLIPLNVNRSPGASKCANVLDRFLWRHGERHLVLLLRTIMESETNLMALVRPVLWAVSDVILEHPERAGGLEWLEAFKAIDLCALFKLARKQSAVSRRIAIATSIRKILASRFGRVAADTALLKRSCRPVAKCSKTTLKRLAAEAPPEFKLWTPPPSPEVRAEAVQRLLISHDRIDIEAAARAELERLLRFRDEGYVNLLVVTILEFVDNENALILPVIEAVHAVMTRHREWTEKGSAWLEAFDDLPPLLSILDDMRALDLFHEPALGKYLGMILDNKLKKYFEPNVEARVQRKPVAEGADRRQSNS